MKKLRAFLTMTIMGIFICAAALRTEAAERPSAVVDNIVYRKNYENDNWCVYSCDKELDYGTVYIKENVNGNVIDEIESSAFKDSKIKKIVIPPSIKKIHACAFQNSGLTELTIPETVQYIQYGRIAADSQELETVYWNNHILKEVPLYSFYNCKKLKNIQFMPGITTIEAGAFKGCSSLKKLVLPDTLKTIEMYAFEACTNLEEIYIPASVTKISSDAFRNTKNAVIKTPKYSIAYYYAKANGMKVKTSGTPQKPIKDRPMLKYARVTGNTLETELLEPVPGAVSYTFFVVYSSWFYDNIYPDTWYVERKLNSKKTKVTMYNLPMEELYVICKATLKNGTEKWSEDIAINIKKPPVEPPKIKKMTVKGRNITVSLDVPKNCKGYDCVLTARYNGLGPQEYVKYVIKNQTKSTVVFKNVAPGTYYFATHAFVREKINSGSKVFSTWASKNMKLTVK